WRVVLAENEDALTKMGWTTIATDQGIAAGESAVTISRFTGGTVLASVFGNKPEQMIPYLADGIARLVAWEVIFTICMSDGAQRHPRLPDDQAGAAAGRVATSPRRGLRPLTLDALWIVIPTGQRASGEWIDDTLRRRAEESGLLARTPQAGRFPRHRVEVI